MQSFRIISGTEVNLKHLWCFSCYTWYIRVVAVIYFYYLLFTATLNQNIKVIERSAVSNRGRHLKGRFTSSLIWSHNISTYIDRSMWTLKRSLLCCDNSLRCLSVFTPHELNEVQHSCLLMRSEQQKSLKDTKLIYKDNIYTLF